MRQMYFVHDDLNRNVKVFYDLNAAERAVHQYCRVQQIPIRPLVAAAYTASHEKFSPLFDKLVG